MNWPLEFERCLDKRWLVRMPEVRYLATRELEVARSDLAEAEAGYERGSHNRLSTAIPRPICQIFWASPPASSNCR